MGFETAVLERRRRKLFCVNLPRWGLKQKKAEQNNGQEARVNLPRWGLKPKIGIIRRETSSSVNLPRWGLKPVLLVIFPKVT